MVKDGAQGRIHTWSKVRLALISMKIQECSTYGTPVVCVLLTLSMLTLMQHPMMGDTHTRHCLRMIGAKRVNILSLDLIEDATS